MLDKIKYLLVPFVWLFLTLPVWAVDLPEGSVEGLPQNLLVIDEEGNSVSALGNYYVHVEDMQPGVVYTKKIAVMNERKDAVYRVYMSMAPNHTEGTIDLEGEVLVKLYLDDELIYTGDVNGIGEPNMQDKPLDLGGIYASGQRRDLRAEFVWNMTEKTEKHIQDNSDAGQTSFGAVDFDWIFSASITEEDDNNKNKGGGGGGRKGTIIYGESTTEEATEDSSEKEPDSEAHSEENPEENSIEGGSEADSEDRSEDTTDEGEDKYTPGGYSHDDDGPGTHTDSEKTRQGSITDKIIDNLPFIPEDVKTGYRSRLRLYVTIVFVSLAAALTIIVFTVYKSIKLKRKLNKNEKTK
ncbi:MAG: hypothetical protein IJS61_10860 [Firmicutes bacterium]|nr:hypothetical protein [Bacillota bacterium]